MYVYIYIYTNSLRSPSRRANIYRSLRSNRHHNSPTPCFVSFVIYWIVAVEDSRILMILRPAIHPAIVNNDRGIESICCSWILRYYRCSVRKSTDESRCTDWTQALMPTGKRKRANCCVNRGSQVVTTSQVRLIPVNEVSSSEIPNGDREYCNLCENFIAQWPVTMPLAKDGPLVEDSPVSAMAH